MGPHQSKPEFLKALFKGSKAVAGVVASCFVVIQMLYGLGWCLYSVMPKHEAHKVTMFGMARDFAADPPAPGTAWLFAADSQTNLVGAGILVVIVAAFVVLLVLGVAWVGGWRNTRMEPFRQWMNT